LQRRGTARPACSLARRRAVHWLGRAAGIPGQAETAECRQRPDGEHGRAALAHDIPLDDSIKEVRKQIENADALALTWLLTFGVDKPEEYDHYYKVMRDAAAYSQERRIKLVMKPHGGSSGARTKSLRP